MSFHVTLLKMGRFRLGISKRFSGAALMLMSVFALMFYLMYFSLLLSLWLIYGVVWLLVFIPCKIIKALNKCRNDAVLEAAGVPMILRHDSVFWLSAVLFPPLAIFILFLRDDKTVINRILCGLCVSPFAFAWIELIIAFFK